MEQDINSNYTLSATQEYSFESKSSVHSHDTSSPYNNTYIMSLTANSGEVFDMINNPQEATTMGHTNESDEDEMPSQDNPNIVLPKVRPFLMHF